jgi:Trk K+ transport system NAD-binding subunit
VDGGTPITATAQDPDGEGPLDLQILDDIELVESTEYTLTMTLANSIEGEDITEEIMEEDDEHMFFFAFTDQVFTSPAGDGNVDNRPDPVNYNDFDENNLPVGLNTSWETECGEEAATGTFRVILKHQPDIKSATSTVDDGGTDVDLTFTVNVSEDPNAPSCENEEEIITDVVLTFTPVDGGTPITATAQDPDGEGPLDLQIVNDIELVESTEYTLAVTLANSIEGEDITEEIMEEDDEHMFFFAFTEDIFANPLGDGNVDNRSDAVVYNDFDENGLPVGLSTSWTTPTNMGFGGTFRIVLKHQPDIKSATSTVNDGGTDVDLTFGLNTTTSISGPQGVLNNQLTLVPNPTYNQLSWRLSGQQPGDRVEVRIISVTGQVLKTYRSPTSQIDVSQLPAGSYLFHVQTEQSSGVKRFIKVD